MLASKKDEWLRAQVAREAEDDELMVKELANVDVEIDDFTLACQSGFTSVDANEEIRSVNEVRTRGASLQRLASLRRRVLKNTPDSRFLISSVSSPSSSRVSLRSGLRTHEQISAFSRNSLESRNGSMNSNRTSSSPGTSKTSTGHVSVAFDLRRSRRLHRASLDSDVVSANSDPSATLWNRDKSKNCAGTTQFFMTRKTVAHSRKDENPAVFLVPPNPSNSMHRIDGTATSHNQQFTSCGPARFRTSAERVSSAGCTANLPKRESRGNGVRIELVRPERAPVRVLQQSRSKSPSQREASKPSLGDYERPRLSLRRTEARNRPDTS